MRLPLALVLAAAAMSSACSDVKCADGTFRKGNDCVPFDPTDTSMPVTTAMPPGTRSRAPVPDFVTLTSSKPATIYYTTDGSDPDPMTSASQPSPAIVPGIANNTTLKFFAIDAAGHRESTNTATYVQDIKPPGQITNLAVSVTNGTATVTWTNPTDPDFAGAVVARVVDLVDGEPTDGQSYAAPGTITPSLQIVHVGTGTQLVDPALPNGQVRYAAWSYDDLFNYSLSTAAGAGVGALGLVATYRFNTGNSTLTLVTAPTDLDVTATTATFATGTITMNLSVKNLTNKYFQLPKALVTGVTNATFTGATGTANGFSYQSLGTAFLAPAATATATLKFTAAVNQTVTINLALGADPAWLADINKPGCCSFGTHGFVDSASGTTFSAAQMDSAPSRRSSGGGGFGPGALVGGRMLDVPTTHVTVERWDLTTYTNTTSAFLATKANVMQVLAVGGYEIAILKNNGRRRTGTITVVRLDEGLHVTGRLDLAVTQSQGHVHAALSPTGVLAIPCDDGIALVDTVSMKQIDADPTTPAIDPIPLVLANRLRAVTFFGSGSIAGIEFQNGEAVIVTPNGSGGYTSSLLTTTGTGRGSAVVTAPDGRVWLAYDNAVLVYDPASGAVGPSGYPNASRALALMDGQLWVLRSDRVSIDLVSTTTGAIQRTVTLPAQSFGHWIQGTDP